MEADARSRKPVGTPSRPPLWKKALIHAFVLFHVAAAVAWSFSSPGSRGSLDRAVRIRLGRYMFPTGLWQSWVMFSPNPARSNTYMEADVTFADGSRATWQFPRVERLGQFERLRKERYRKWATERIWVEGKVDPVLAEAAARFAARQVARRPDNPPAVVELIRYRAPIPRPTPDQFSNNPPEPVWERRLVFTYQLDPAGNVVRVITPATVPTSQPAAPGREGGDDDVP